MAASLTYGILGLADIGSDTLLTDVSRDSIINAVNLSTAEHNRSISLMLNAFCDVQTNYKERYLLPGGGKLQPTDEHGVARPTKGASYDIAFPILQGSSAWGSDYVALKKMSVKRFSQTLTDQLNKDLASVRDLIYANMFYNLSWTFVDDEFGSLTIKPLANSDTDKFPLNNATELATDTHFLAQAAAIADATNPFPTIRDEILEHASVNTLGDVIAFIPTSAVAAVSALTEFVPVSNPVVVVGDNTATVRGAGPTLPVPGQVIGYLSTSKTWVVVLRTLPTGYLFAITENGPRPLGVREDREESLRGFKPVGNRDAFPFFEEQWMRRIGIGAANRVGAVALYFGTSGTYAVPTGYSPKTL